MGCSHKKRELISSGTYAGKFSDTVIDVYVCFSCGAMRVDSRNDYAYQEGKWSQPKASRVTLKEG